MGGTARPGLQPLQGDSRGARLALDIGSGSVAGGRGVVVSVAGDGERCQASWALRPQGGWALGCCWELLARVRWAACLVACTVTT